MSASDRAASSHMPGPSESFVSHCVRAVTAPDLAIASCVSGPLLARRARARAAFFFAPVLLSSPSNLTSGGMAPCLIISRAFSVSRAAPEITVAACSSEARDSSPLFRELIAGPRHPSSTILSRQAWSVAKLRLHNAYSCASTRPSLKPSLSSVTSGPRPLIEGFWLSSPPSAAISRNAMPARLRTSSLSSPRSLTSSCVTLPRSIVLLSASCESAFAARDCVSSLPVCSCLTSCETAPAFARAPRLSGSSDRV